MTRKEKLSNNLQYPKFDIIEVDSLHVDLNVKNNTKLITVKNTKKKRIR